MAPLPSYQAKSLGRLEKARFRVGRGAFVDTSRLLLEDAAKPMGVAAQGVRLCGCLDGVRAEPAAGDLLRTSEG
jgi:hypothetical protein